MVKTREIETNFRLISALILTSVVWMSIALAQCVYAGAIDNSAAHNDSSHCVLLDSDLVKHDKDCVDCSGYQIALPAQEITYFENFDRDEENQPNYVVLASSNEHTLVNDFKCIADTTVQLQNKYSPPIYLKNCAFLN